MSVKPQLNPFYIERGAEEPEQDEYWDGDWRDDDDEDFEDEGLLPVEDYDHEEEQWHFHHSRQRGRVGRRHKNNFALPSQNTGTHVRLRYCLAVSAVFLIFMILLSLTENSSPSSTSLPSPSSEQQQTDAAAPTADDSGSGKNTTSGSNSTNSSSTSTKDSNDTNNNINATVMDHDNDGIIPEIVILGERNSGVQWLQERLQECYPTVTVSTRLSRHTFWFQDGPPPSSSRRRSILLVAMFRNPYDWIYQMQQHPMYMPAHMSDNNNNSTTAGTSSSSTPEPMSLEQFVETPWTLPLYTGDDPNDGNNNNNNNSGNVSCQLGFQPDQVVPCHATDDDPEQNLNNPIYELNRQYGTPFINIAQLRAAKIRHFVLQVPQLWSEHVLVALQPQQQPPIIVQYESPLRTTLQAVDAFTGWQSTCSNDDDNAVTAPVQERPSLAAFEAWVDGHVNWDAEAKIGYQKRGRSTFNP